MFKGSIYLDLILNSENIQGFFILKHSSFLQEKNLHLREFFYKLLSIAVRFNVVEVINKTHV